VRFAHSGVIRGRNIDKPRGFQEADLEPEEATKKSPASVVHASTIFFKRGIRGPYRSSIAKGQRLAECDEIEQ
jgi:hypothetical protein